MFVMLGGVPYEAARKLTMWERHAIRHGRNISGTMFLIVAIVAFVAASILSYITQAMAIPVIVFVALSLVGCAAYCWYAIVLGNIVHRLTLDGKLVQSEAHIEKYYLLVAAIREMLIGHGFHPTDEYIAEMLNRQRASVEFIRGLDPDSPILKDEIVVVTKAILQAEARDGQAKM